MSLSPFAEKYAKAILKKACKGKSHATYLKTLQAVLDAKMGPPSYDAGGVSLQLGEEALALAEARVQRALLMHADWGPESAAGFRFETAAWSLASHR